MRMSGKRIAFVIAVELIIAAVMAVVALDLRLHAEVERAQGVNTRGFRGILRFSHWPGGRRVAVLGGSAAYGVGVEWSSSMPYYLERALNQTWRLNYPGFYTDVVNLAAVLPVALDAEPLR